MGSAISARLCAIASNGLRQIASLNSGTSSLVVRGNALAGQSQRVYPTEWIGGVLLEIAPAGQSDGIFRDKPPATRVVIPVSVVVQPRLVVKVLPLEPNRIPEPRLPSRLADRLLGFAPGLVLRRPGDPPLMVRQLLRRAQVVALVERDLFSRKGLRRLELLPVS